MRHTLFCRSMWQETQGTTAHQTGLFLCWNQKSLTQKSHLLLWVHMCKNTHMPLLLCNLGDSLHLGSGSP